MLQKETLELFHSWRISVCDAPRPFGALPFCAVPGAFVVPLFSAVSRPVLSALALFVPPFGAAVVVGTTVVVGIAVDVGDGTALAGAGFTNFFGGGFDGGVASAFIFARAFCAAG
jgi:hypothetical protein